MYTVLSQTQKTSSDMVNEKQHVQTPAAIFERHCIWLHHKFEFIWYILLPLRVKVHCSNVCVYMLAGRCNCCDCACKLIILPCRHAECKWVHAWRHAAYFTIVKCCSEQKYSFSIVLEIVICNALLQPRLSLWVCHTHTHTFSYNVPW